MPPYKYLKSGALIGWILMIPSIQPVFSGSSVVAVNPSDDMSSWWRLHTFPSQDACEKAAWEFPNKAPPPPPGSSKDLITAINVQKTLVRCVSEDDPRLTQSN
jgi:hypothetical protein